MGFVTVHASERDWTLRCLSVRELAAIGSDQHERDRRQLLADLDDAKATPPQRVEALREHAKSRDLVHNALLACYRFAGASAVIRQSFEKSGYTGRDADEFIEAVTGTNLVETALRLVAATLEPDSGKAEGATATPTG